MATYVRYEFYYSEADMLRLKNSVMAGGYGPRKFYIGAKLVSVVTYFGYSIFVATTGQRVKIPRANNFSAFLYTYPVVKKNYMYLNRVHGSGEGSRFFDDTLEDKLGGARSMLGV